MTRRGWIYALPVLVFAALMAGFYYGLQIDSTVLPSALIDEPAPRFDLPPLPGHEPGFSSADLAGHVWPVYALFGEALLPSPYRWPAGVGPARDRQHRQAVG